MKQTIGNICLMVREYDEAISFYTEKLKFTLVEDIPMGGEKRWVVVAPPGSEGARLLLAKAATPAQQNSIGNQTGGRVFLFLHTDDFWRDYREMKSRDIKFLEEPRNEPFGTVVVFEDLYGNKWDFIESKNDI